MIGIGPISTANDPLVVFSADALRIPPIIVIMKPRNIKIMPNVITLMYWLFILTPTLLLWLISL